MDRRRFVGGIAGGLLAVPLAARAQQPVRIPRIGYVSGTAGLPIKDLTSKDSVKGCAISVKSREELFPSEAVIR